VETVARWLHAPEFLSAESGVTGDEIGPVSARPTVRAAARPHVNTFLSSPDRNRRSCVPADVVRDVQRGAPAHAAVHAVVCKWNAPSTTTRYLPLTP
jgi:hypothetical protein